MTLRSLWSRREAVAGHDLSHLHSVRRPARRRVDYLGGLAEVLRTDGGWRDHAECLRVPAAVVVEPVNGVDSSGQHFVDTVHRID